MDSEGKYDRTLRGFTPRGAAEMIRKRLTGAGSVPVTCQEDASGFDFFIGGIPAARLQVYSDDPSDWHVDVYNVGRPFTGVAAKFLNEWRAGSYRRARYVFARHDSTKPNMFTTKAVGNSLKAAPNMHARFKEDLNDGAQICAMLQRLFGGSAKRHVVQARFTVKFGSKKRGVPDRMISTFWVSDKKLFEYRGDVKVLNEDGTAKAKTTLTQRIKACQDGSGERSTPNMAELAKFHARNGKAFFSLGGLRKSSQMREDLYRVFPQFAPTQETGIASPVKVDSSEFTKERAAYALHAIYTDILGEDNIQYGRPCKALKPWWTHIFSSESKEELDRIARSMSRRSPHSSAVAKTPRSERERRVLDRVHAQELEARKDTAKAIPYEEFLKALPDDPMAELEKLEAFKEFEGAFDALKQDRERDATLLYTAAYAVFMGYRVSIPASPAANIGAIVASSLEEPPRADSRFLSEAAPSSWGSAPGEYETTLDMAGTPAGAGVTVGLITLDGRIAELTRTDAAKERDAYKSMEAAWEEANKDYPELAAYIGDVRDALLDADDIIAGGAGSTKTYRIGGARFVHAGSALGQLAAKHNRMVETARLAREASNAGGQRRIETAKKNKRDQQKKAVEAGKQDLASAESGAGSGKKHAVRDARGRFAKKGSVGSNNDKAGKNAGTTEKAKSQIAKVPVEIDAWCRALGPNFSRAGFIAACRDRNAYTLKSLEKAAYKHVTYFESRGWEWKKNPKISAIVRVIEEEGGTHPRDYKPAKSARSGRPRGQKRQHNNNGNNGGGQKPKRDGYSRKHAPQTGTTSGLGNSP